VNKARQWSCATNSGRIITGYRLGLL